MPTKKGEPQTKKLGPLYKESREGLGVPPCRSTARHFISCGNMQNAATEEALSLCSPWQRYHSNVASQSHTNTYYTSSTHNKPHCHIAFWQQDLSVSIYSIKRVENITFQSLVTGFCNAI